MDENPEDGQTRTQVLDAGHRTRGRIGHGQVHVSGVGPFAPAVSVGGANRVAAAGSHYETVRDGQTGKSSVVTLTPGFLYAFVEHPPPHPVCTYVRRATT